MVERAARMQSGEVAEWPKAPHSKCGVPERVPWVQIPPSPLCICNSFHRPPFGRDMRLGEAPHRLESCTLHNVEL